MLAAHLNQKLSELVPQDEKFAIAFSGGGDSTALVHALRHHPQAKAVYIVDHDLRAASNAEALAAEAFATTCGYDAKILKWKHNLPKTAIQEKARKARYGLMGNQCRKDGIEYLLTAHSEDDQAETLLMRYDRKTDWRGAVGMAEVTYGAVWPELASVNLVRPLLGIKRETLREYNREHELRWTEDPSNENRDYARIRARDYLKARSELREALLGTAVEMRAGMTREKERLRSQFSRIGQVDENGIITFQETPLPELMFYCLRCAGGQGGVIDRAKIKNLLVQMRTPSFKSVTLGGAMVAKQNPGFIICRDPVAVKGRQDSHHVRKNLHKRLNFKLNDTPQLWDGRFLVTDTNEQRHMGSVFHNRALLTEEQNKALREIPMPARDTLPVSIIDRTVHILGAGDNEGQMVKSIVKTRLEAALGGPVS